MQVSKKISVFHLIINTLSALRSTESARNLLVSHPCSTMTHLNQSDMDYSQNHVLFYENQAIKVSRNAYSIMDS